MRSGLPLLRPALFWALLHAGLILLFFQGGLLRSLANVPSAMHPALWAGFAVQSLTLALAIWLLTIPLLLSKSWYAWLAPLVVSLGFVLLYLDSLLYDSLGFHFNGLILQVAFQGDALEQTGLSHWEVATYLGGAAALLALDVFLGKRFILRFAAPRSRGLRSWPWATAILLLWGMERLSIGAMTFYGGHAVLAAGTTLPLQPPIRMSNFMEKLTGEKPMFGEILIRDLPRAGEAMGALDPADVHFQRKPDVLFLLVESTRSDFFQPEVMPRLSRRAKEEGRIFRHHYTGAPSTHFALFNIFFGLDAHRSDATIGAGRAPLLFPALKKNGYATSLIASSSVDWMDLTDTVFRDVKDDLITGLRGPSHVRDGDMVDRAKEVIAATPADQPLFLFLFFNGTHFNYSYPERSAVFEPAWDGAGSLKATSVDAELLKNRFRNSLREVDTKIEDFLEFYEEVRGAKPLLIFTSDHGEEFREHGRVGHGSDVTREQIQVPLVIIDEEMPKGVHEGVSGHADLVPTILSLLGDDHDPSLYSDGLPIHLAPAGRFVLATIGWEPRFAVIGDDLKVRFYSLDAGLGSVQVTDHEDRLLPDARARFAAESVKILRRLRGGMGERRAPPQAANAGLE